jgi:hypothetical protein
MNTFDIFVSCTYFILLPLSTLISKNMYKRAISYKWKKPEDYKTFGSFLMVIPAQAVTRLISKATPDTFFLHGIDEYNSFGGFIAMLSVFLVIYVIMIVPTKLLSKRYPIPTIESSTDK